MTTVMTENRRHIDCTQRPRWLLLHCCTKWSISSCLHYLIVSICWFHLTEECVCVCVWDLSACVIIFVFEQETRDSTCAACLCLHLSMIRYVLLQMNKLSEAKEHPLNSDLLGWQSFLDFSAMSVTHILNSYRIMLALCLWDSFGCKLGLR